MAVYKFIELVGTSSDSWEHAAAVAVEQAATSVRDIRIAEVIEQDLQIGENAEIVAYRTKLRVSFRIEGAVD